MLEREGKRVALKRRMCIGRDAGKRLLAAAGVLAATALVGLAGSNGLTADRVEQDAWHLIRAEAVPEGIAVETAGENLVLHAGVRARADSEESRAFSAANVRDGICDEEGLRWSSANDWENNEHWLEIDFGQEVTAGLVRIYWERTNARVYALEYSSDGKSWDTAAAFTQPPEQERQDISFREPVKARYLRLHVTDVTKEEADLSLYYQNVSVLELEVYEGIEDSFLIEKPRIPAGKFRRLELSGNGIEGSEMAETAVKLPEVPDGYALEFVGADYEMLVDAEGRIANTIGNTAAELGFALIRDGVCRELPGMQVEIPAAVQDGTPPERTELPPEEQEASQDGAQPERTELSPEALTALQDGAQLPDDFGAMEWAPCGGHYGLTHKTRIVIAKGQEEELLSVAQLFAQELSGYLGREVEVVCDDAGEPGQGTGTPGQDAQTPGRDAAEGSHGEKKQKEHDSTGGDDIRLSLIQDDGIWPVGLGKEGYELDLGAESRTDMAEETGEAGGIFDTQISAETAQGVRWGCVSFLSLLEKSQGELPKGRLRDYPRYSVRGFGIDVGRRPVSLELLCRIVQEMSEQKMNTLQVHLNDNQIIAQSGYDGTVEGARSLYAGFRLESALENEAGEKITSQDLFYTKEEFAQFIADAAAYGVEIVPEIDTPAHSLAITNVFPKLGLSRDPESVDQLNLSDPEAVELGKALWSEYLSDGTQNGGENAGAPDGEAVRNAEAAGGADSVELAASESIVFGACSAVHIGMDEYFGDEKEYISYLKKISEHVAALAPDKNIRIWGSLSKIGADHSGVSKDLQMHIWDTDWADPQDMYDEGFSIINSLSSSLYIIPGGGYDWLDREFLKKSWQPNVFETQERTWELPSYSPQMLGAVYMMWNDWAQLNGEDITEDDLFDRFSEPLPVIAGKLWGSPKK